MDIATSSKLKRIKQNEREREKERKRERDQIKMNPLRMEVVLNKKEVAI